MLPTSLSLLDRLREPSDTTAWQRLVDLYTPFIANWLQRAGLQAADAEDLTQEVLLTLVLPAPHSHGPVRRGQ